MATTPYFILSPNTIEVIAFRRIKRVAKTVYRELWGAKRKGRKTSERLSLKIANDDDSTARVV